MTITTSEAAELAMLRKDAARLDWLEANRHEMYLDYKGWMAVRIGGGKVKVTTSRPTAREAIDAAMRGEYEE